MKKNFVILIFIILVLTSCKKKADEVPPTCELTVTGLIGLYKISKLELNTGSGFSDVTNVYLTACEKDDTYNFKTNGVFEYVDAGTVCSPNGSGTGTWSVSAGKLTFQSPSVNGVELVDATLSNNNCTSFIATEVSGGITSRVTFSK